MSARASSFAIALLLTSCTGLVNDNDPASERSEGSSRGDDDDRSSAGDESTAADGDDSDDSTSSDDSSDDSDDSSSDDADDMSSDDSSGDDSSGDSSGDDTSGADDFDDIDENTLDWQAANVTNFESYPEEGSEECIEFSGCDYFGQFAALDGQQSLEWVQDHNIAAVHSNDFDQYANKTLRLRDGQNEIDVVVYDLCSDSDCDGCCTQNASETGFLIDLEVHTAERFGLYDGVVEWACLDC